MLETKISYQYEKWDYFVVLTFVLTTGTIIWFHYLYLQPIITQYFIDNKSEIWLLFLIAHSKR